MGSGELAGQSLQALWEAEQAHRCGRLAEMTIRKGWECFHLECTRQFMRAAALNTGILHPPFGGLRCRRHPHRSRC